MPKPIAWEAALPNPKLKLLEQVREVLPLRHYSIRTEQSYCDWIRRYVRFHRMHSREELPPGEPKSVNARRSVPMLIVEL